jgi:hypothetical protein
MVPQGSWIYAPLYLRIYNDIPQVNVFMIRHVSCSSLHGLGRRLSQLYRLTSFPILLFIALYERQAKRTGALTFYETMSAAAEKVFDTLPRGLKRLCKCFAFKDSLRFEHFFSFIRGPGWR